jgi:hypothetical protein
MWISEHRAIADRYHRGARKATKWGVKALETRLGGAGCNGVGYDGIADGIGDDGESKTLPANRCAAVAARAATWVHRTEPNRRALINGSSGMGSVDTPWRRKSRRNSARACGPIRAARQCAAAERRGGRMRRSGGCGRTAMGSAGGAVSAGLQISGRISSGWLASWADL